MDGRSRLVEQWPARGDVSRSKHGQPVDVRKTRLASAGAARGRTPYMPAHESAASGSQLSVSLTSASSVC